VMGGGLVAKKKTVQKTFDGEDVEVLSPKELESLIWTTTTLSIEAGVERARIRRLAIDGRFPGAFKVGRDWAIPDESARHWLSNDRDRRRTFAEDAGSTD